MYDTCTGTRNAAVDWLLAEYEATDLDTLAHYNENTDEWVWPHYIQPMFTLKSDMEPGADMRVCAADYKDPERWWL